MTKTRDERLAALKHGPGSFTFTGELPARVYAGISFPRLVLVQVDNERVALKLRCLSDFVEGEVEAVELVEEPEAKYEPPPELVELPPAVEKPTPKKRGRPKKAKV
jgi:hypothetical protein